MPDVRAALSLLPRGAITGIGSLPHTQMELALQMALAVDVPYLPQLPSQNPSELMVPAALEGLPGLEAGEDGACTVELGAWEAGKEPADLPRVDAKHKLKAEPRDVFAYVIHEGKVRAPAAAMALIEGSKE